MNKRFVTYFFILTMSILVVLIWRQKARNRNSATIPPKSDRSSNAVAKTNAFPTQAIVNTAIKSSFVQNDRDKPVAFLQMIDQKNSPIDFYGKINDQNNNPVSGVKMNFTVRQWYVPVPTIFDEDAHFIPIKKETDVSGRFEIHGVSGDGFGIVIAPKNGYILSPKVPRSFGPSAGSLQNPIIIRMWKEGAKEPLIGGSHVFGIDSGKTYILDLINGKKIQGETEGDLRVSITRPSGVKPRDRYEWSFSIKAIQGGLLESDDEFMYLAPEAGYEPKIEMHLDPSDPAWTGLVKKQFFIRSRNGQVYGRA